MGVMEGSGEDGRGDGHGEEPIQFGENRSGVRLAAVLGPESLASRSSFAPSVPGESQDSPATVSRVDDFALAVLVRQMLREMA